MNNETNPEPIDYEARVKTLEEDNEKLKLALTEVNLFLFSFSSILTQHFKNLFSVPKTRETVNEKDSHQGSANSRLHKSID